MTYTWTLHAGLVVSLILISRLAGYYAFNPVFKEQMERKNDPALNVGQTGKQQQPQQPASTTSNST